MSLIMTIAAPFRFTRKDRLKKNEIVYFFVYDRRWMSVEQANLLITRALEEKAIGYDGEMLLPLFDPASVNIPIGFRPSSGVFEPRDPVHELIDRISRSVGMSDVQVTGEMNQLISDRFDSHLRPEAAVVLLARKYGIDAADLLAALESEILKNR